MKKTRNMIPAAIIMTALLMVFCSCGIAGSDQVEAVIDGVTYTLDSDWQIDEKEKTISYSGEEIYYTIEQDIVDKCSSIEEREDLYPDDGSDGIELTEIEINGTKALLTKEPVNEIVYCQIYFYVNGEEHEIWFEPDYGKESEFEPYTEELIKGMSW